MYKWLCRSILFSLLIISNVFVLSAQIEGPTVSEDKRTPIDNHPLPTNQDTRFAAVDRWSKNTLTYRFLNCPSALPCGDAQDAVRSAMQVWNGLTNIEFVESGGLVDVEIQWTTTFEDLGEVGGALAYAFFPRFGGDIYFDDAEPWTLFDRGEWDFYLVALHELGHTLGLDHSDDENAIMYPYSGFATDIGQDDINGIQYLYGTPDGTVPSGDGNQPDLPSFNFDFLSDDDIALVPDDSGTDTTDPDVPTTEETEVVEGSISNEIVFEVWELSAVAGETVTITMVATGGDLDAYLGLVTLDGETVLAEDDDSLNQTDAMLTYTFAETTTVAVVATRYDTESGTTSGTYTLTAYRTIPSEEGDPVAPPDDVLSDTNPYSLIIDNQSGTDICAIWVSSSDQDVWGEASGVQIPTDGSETITVSASGAYDIRVEDCFDNALEEYVVGVFGPVHVTISSTEITTETKVALTTE